LKIRFSQSWPFTAATGFVFNTDIRFTHTLNTTLSAWLPNRVNIQ
jgi:hypothetical protein